MARIDLLLFGYYSITVCDGEGSILTVTNLFLKNGIAERNR